jgi:DNA-binding MarR family transcriptional regulator
METISGITAPARPDVDLATGLVRLARVVQDVFARVSARHDLTAAQARLLCVLTDGPKGMAKLAGILGVEKAAMTGLIDRLERRGLVQRTAVPGDRRACHVALTPAGGQRALAVHEEVGRDLDALTSSLSATRRRELLRVVLDITQASGGHETPVTPPDSSVS